MNKNNITKSITLFTTFIILVGLFFACIQQPSITKKYLPAQAAITSSQKIKIWVPKQGYQWVMQHDGHFIFNNQDYTFRFICKIGSYNTGDTIDIFYNPKRPKTVVVYSVPEKALNLAEDGEHDSIYFNYDEVKAFFDSVHMHSKTAAEETK